MTIEKVRRYVAFGAREDDDDIRDILPHLPRYIEASEVDGLVAAALDARDALHACIDALSSEEESDHEALDALTKAIARFAK